MTITAEEITAAERKAEEIAARGRETYFDDKRRYKTPAECRFCCSYLPAFVDRNCCMPAEQGGRPDIHREPTDTCPLFFQEGDEAVERASGDKLFSLIKSGVVEVRDLGRKKVIPGRSPRRTRDPDHN